LTSEELQVEMDKLPNQSPDFLIGWLMSQVVWLINEIERKNYEEDT
tara:strand:- start:199 stop:336 length:138 start_codon:yes stop_codon:yes gene_type:complete